MRLIAKKIDPALLKGERVRMNRQPDEPDEPPKAWDPLNRRYTRICSVPDCGKRHDAHGFCSMHGDRVRRFGSIELPEGRRRPGNPNYVTKLYDNCECGAVATVKGQCKTCYDRHRSQAFRDANPFIGPPKPRNRNRKAMRLKYAKKFIKHDAEWLAERNRKAKINGLGILRRCGCFRCNPHRQLIAQGRWFEKNLRDEPKIRELLARGLSIHAVSKEVGCNRRKVRKIRDLISNSA